jgi:hypothetical protein
MNYKFLAATAILGFASAMAFADDVPTGATQPTDTPQPAAAPQPAEAPQPPRDHIDTTVVGSNSAADSPAQTEVATLANQHQFEAGAPEIVRVIDKLHLSQRQKVQVNGAIERADAGAAVLINRERDVKEMLSATTPQDPMFNKLMAEQAGEDGRWNENRDGLRRDVMAVLTPAQRTRFEELQASR